MLSYLSKYFGSGMLHSENDLFRLMILFVCNFVFILDNVSVNSDIEDPYLSMVPETLQSDESMVFCMQRQSFSITGLLANAFTNAIALAFLYLPLFVPSNKVVLPTLDAITAFFTLCQKEFVRGRAETAAFEAAESFQGIPEVVLDDSLNMLVHQFDGSLPHMIREAQQSKSQVRFNESRCRDVFSDDPEFPTLLTLATEGAAVPIQDDFVIQNTPEPLRKLHLRLGNCIPQHAFKLWEAGKALLFRIVELPLHIMLHFNNSHWTSKPDTVDGRYLFDCANIANGSTINSDESFSEAENLYKPLTHPTILSILRSAVELALSLGCPLSDLRLWKDDIKGAFGQFNFDPRSCYLMATQVAFGVVMIYISGCFGYHACPLIFGVFSRAITRVLARSCSGSVYVYVDDLIGFSHMSAAVNDQRIAQEVIIRTFGPNSLAEKSLLPCQSGEILGWTVDLIRELVRPNDKAIRKLMFAFFTVDIRAEKWPLRQCQMLASLAERYSLALCGMRNFVQPLHNMCRSLPKEGSLSSFSQNRSRMRVTSAARVAVEMWRVVAICLFADPLCFAIPIRSLIRDSSIAELYFISDAGPLLAGFAIYDSYGCLLFYSAYTWPFVRNDNYQNAKEFLAFLLALVSAVLMLDVRDCCIHWTGDNSSALSWVADGRCQSSFAQLAFIAYSFLCLRRNLCVVDVKHRPGHLMGAIDALSRNNAHDLDPKLLRSIDDFVIIKELTLLCDPILLLNARLEDHHIAFQKVVEVINKLE